MSGRKNGEPCVRGVRMLCKYCNQKNVCSDSEYEMQSANKKTNCDKFTMELVWHNCKTHPPKELYNDDLIVTNGSYVFDMSWFRDKGYFIAVNGGNDHRIQEALLENWWWADIQQTVQGEPRFRGLIVDDLVDTCVDGKISAHSIGIKDGKIYIENN